MQDRIRRLNTSCKKYDMEISIEKTDVFSISRNQSHRAIDQTESHIVGGCSKLLEVEYKRRHDKIARAVLGNLLGCAVFSG